MNFYKLCFSLLLIFSSCSVGPTDQISIFNNIKFKLLKGEIQIEKNKEELENYERIFSYPKFQLPLFKIINSEFYKIYVGLPYGVKKDVFITTLNNEKKGLSQRVIIENDNILKIFENDNAYFCEYYIEIKNKMVLYFGIEYSKRKFRDQELFSINDILNRIIVK